MTEMRVVVEEYGPLIVDVVNQHEQSIAGAYYNAVGNYLAGGSPGKSAEYYEDKIFSFEGETVSGEIIQGPAELIGELLEDHPLEIDPEILAADASALNFSDSPYESWS